MNNTEVDVFGIVKKFPDLQGGITIVQGGPEWHERDSEHGYASIPGVKIRRKTFSFNKKLKPDQEVTIYVSLPKLNPEYGSHEGIGHCKSGSGQSIKLRGGKHPSENDDPNSAKCYIFHYEYEGGKCNNFQKEYPHPRYSKNTIDEESQFPNWIGKVMGFKAALLNTNDGKNVEFWAWYDPSAKVENGKLVPGNNWLLRYHGMDNGQFGNTPKTKPPFLETHGDYTEFRMDNADINTKAFCASLREIRRP
ncbi:MAG TPA: hypothetical protein VH481_08975 [Nitrososphaeraceae archaeon]|jgi:hypothetical protein